MKTNLSHTFGLLAGDLLLFVSSLTSCNTDEAAPYVLQQNDIRVEQPAGGFTATVGMPFRIEVESVSDEGLSYAWSLDGKRIAETKDLEYTFAETGDYTLILHVSQAEIAFDYPFAVHVGLSYTLQKEDIRVDMPEGGFIAYVAQLLRIEVESVSDEGVTYAWWLDGERIAATKNLEYMFEKAGQYTLQLEATQEEISFTYDFPLSVEFDGQLPDPGETTPYITKVLDFMPAVGQFTNKLPEYEEGDTQETMNQKVLEAIGNNNRGMISLGGFGGYVVVGFDHTIENVAGKRDFRVLGNAFYAASNPDPDAPDGGSCEPGVIMVAYDVNGNGVPDDNEWYEIAGSAHVDPTQELWYQKAKDNGNLVETYFDYEITYYKPANEPASKEEWDTYIRWTDNRGGEGYKVKNQYHQQSYWPQWAEGDRLTFKGTCLPQNGIDESGAGNYYVLYKFRYGYADNETNTNDESAIDIDWAVNDKGQKVHLPGVDFIKIYTGVNQENGWLGECSTEIMGVEDLHLLGTEIDTRE